MVVGRAFYNMQRYFGQIIGNNVVLEESDQRHLLKVMRMHAGDVIEVANEGEIYVCQIESIKPLNIRVARKLKEDHEIHANIILACGLLKGDKMDFVIQKTCELGVGEIILVKSHRSIAKISSLDKEAKLSRFSRIAKEACEQCKRSTLPILRRVIDFDQIDELKAKYRLIAHVDDEGGSKTTSFISTIKKMQTGDSIIVLIGPEGGFDDDEVKYAQECGYENISLGKRVLRAETASIDAVAVISSLLESK